MIGQMFQLPCMIEKWTPKFLTLFTTFYDLSVLRNLFSNAEIRQFGGSRTEGLKELISDEQFVMEDWTIDEYGDLVEARERPVPMPGVNKGPYYTVYY